MSLDFSLASKLEDSSELISKRLEDSENLDSERSVETEDSKVSVLEEDTDSDSSSLALLVSSLSDVRALSELEKAMTALPRRALACDTEDDEPELVVWL